jgi:hypothetical protein
VLPKYTSMVAVPLFWIVQAFRAPFEEAENTS